MKLSNTQKDTLEAAAARPQGDIFPLPANVNPGVKNRVIQGLLSRELIDEDNDHYTINAKGFDAIGKIPPTFKKNKKQTKNALLLELISEPKGKSLDDICEATGWQKHSVRGAISVLKSKGHNIVSEKIEGMRTYNIKTEN